MFCFAGSASSAPRQNTAAQLYSAPFDATGMPTAHRMSRSFAFSISAIRLSPALSSSRLSLNRSPQV